VALVSSSECCTERKFHGSESSLGGLFARGNESAQEHKSLQSVYVYRVTNYITFQCQTHYKTMPCNHCVSMCHFIRQNVSLYVCYVKQ